MNGEVPTGAFRRVLGYVTQDVTYFESLTVREVLRYGAQLSMSRDNHSAADIEAKVDHIIDMLDIAKCADSRIGNSSDSGGISGGERRRLAVGMELLSDPALLFLGKKLCRESCEATHVTRTTRAVSQMSPRLVWMQPPLCA